MGSSRRRRHPPGQIVGTSREADRLLDEGQEVAVVAGPCGRPRVDQ